MKKLFSILLSVAFMISLVPSAFAAHSPISTKATDEVMGEVIYEDSIFVTDPSNVKTSSRVDIIVSSVTNSDGSVTIYEYHNNELSQYHSTFPGSGILYSTYLNDDGSSRTETTITKDDRSTFTSLPSPDTGTDVSTRSSSNYTSTESNINNPTSVRNLGFMHYRHNFTNTLYSIDCEIIERYHPNEEFTFNENTGGSISFWVGTITSVLMLTAAPGTFFARKIVQKLITIGVIALGAGTTYFGVGSHTIRCNWYEQEIHGDPTAPSGQGQDIYLSGIYAFVDYGDGPEVETEGYTARDWGNPSMGRWMMYNVFGIDDSPHTWTNLDRSLVPEPSN